MGSGGRRAPAREQFRQLADIPEKRPPRLAAIEFK